MKAFYFFIFLSVSFGALPCSLPVPESEAARYIEAYPSGVPPLFTCKDKPQESCMCSDNLEWGAAEVVDNYVNGAPIYTINSQVACIGEEDCQLKMSELVCDENFTAMYRLDDPQAYCYRVDGYEQVLQGKKLQNNPAKLAQLQAERAAEESNRNQKQIAKRAARKALREANVDGANSVAALKQLVKALLIATEDE